MNTRPPADRKTPLEPAETEKLSLDAEWKLAAKRVGDVHHKLPLTAKTQRALQWFISFVQKDFSLLSRGDWSNLQYEVAVVTTRAITPWTDKRTIIAAPAWGPECVPGVNTDETLLLPSKEQIETLQRDTKTLVDRFIDAPLAHESFRLNVNADLHLTKHKSKKNPLVLSVALDDPKMSFNLALLFLLSEHGNHLRRCLRPECRLIFLATHLNRQFCSKPCGLSVRLRRYYQKHKKKLKRKNRDRKRRVEKWRPKKRTRKRSRTSPG